MAFLAMQADLGAQPLTGASSRDLYTMRVPNEVQPSRWPEDTNAALLAAPAGHGPNIIALTPVR
ncbi:hypothetical protein AOQ73_25055 [Bradyrhizobium pachyrhizi]|nr:hypothetical protein AOQ73_25055 [Bradyrhizobium pachyrhizi]